MRTINKGHLSVVNAVSTDETRFTLNGVLLEEVIDKKLKGLKATATDGRLLAQYTSFNDESENFPVIQEMIKAPNTNTKAIIPTKTILSVKKALPKKSKYLRVLTTALVKIGDEKTTFGTTDLEKANVFPAENIDGHYPDYKQIIPKNAPLFKIALGAKYLKKIAQIVGEVEGCLTVVENRK